MGVRAISLNWHILIHALELMHKCNLYNYNVQLKLQALWEWLDRLYKQQQFFTPPLQFLLSGMECVVHLLESGADFWFALFNWMCQRDSMQLWASASKGLWASALTVRSLLRHHVKFRLGCWNWRHTTQLYSSITSTDYQTWKSSYYKPPSS